MTVVAKPGTRFRSVVCETEIVVVKGGTGEIDLRCGGVAVVAIDDASDGGAPESPFDGGSLVGKRYVSDDGSIEILCTKGGAGSLSFGDAVLVSKGAKPLPASD